ALFFRLRMKGGHGGPPLHVTTPGVVRMRSCLVVLISACVFAASFVRADEPQKRPPQSIGGIDSPSGGTVTGIIRFKGTKPEAKPIQEIAGNAFCKEHQENGEIPLHDNF